MRVIDNDHTHTLHIHMLADKKESSLIIFILLPCLHLLTLLCGLRYSDWQSFVQALPDAIGTSNNALSYIWVHQYTQYEYLCLSFSASHPLQHVQSDTVSNACNAAYTRACEPTSYLIFECISTHSMNICASPSLPHFRCNTCNQIQNDFLHAHPVGAHSTSHTSFWMSMMFFLVHRPI